VSFDHAIHMKYEAVSSIMIVLHWTAIYHTVSSNKIVHSTRGTHAFCFLGFGALGAGLGAATGLAAALV